jgi:hypothetical protein
MPREGEAETNRKPRTGMRLSVIKLTLSLVGVGVLILIAFSLLPPIRYLEEAKEDSARQYSHILEQACKKYFINHNGILPSSLDDLITSQGGAEPAISGGPVALLDPWGQPYQYDPTNKSPIGEPDPIVFTIHPTTKKTIYAVGRRR